MTVHGINGTGHIKQKSDGPPFAPDDGPKLGVKHGIEPTGLTPAAYFEKVALEDLKQNKRLSRSGMSGTRSYKLNGAQDDGARVTRMRFVVCTLGVVGMAVSQMSRMVINVSITQMVDKSAHQHSDDNQHQIEAIDGSCPWPADEQRTTEICMSTERSPVGGEFEMSLPGAAEPATLASSSTLPPGETWSFGPSTSSNGNADDGAEPPVSPGNAADWYELETERNESEPTPTTTEQMLADVGVADDGDQSDATSGTEPGDESSMSLAIAPAPSEQHTDHHHRDLDQTTADSHKNEQLPGHRNHAITNETVTSSPLPAPAVASAYPRFKWTIQQQNVLLGGFYYSYFVFMVLGGRMAEIYGAKYVLMLSVAGSAVINLATPWLAVTSFHLLVVSRIVMGAIQAGVFPATYALMGKWLTITEASIFAPLIKMSLRLGSFFGTLIPGLVTGWTNVFYLSGTLSAVWSILWFVVATSDPADNFWVSRGELARINRKKRCHAKLEHNETNSESVELDEGPKWGAYKAANGTTTMATDDAQQGRCVPTDAGNNINNKANVAPVKRGTPWIKLITAPSVIALMIVKLTFNYALDFLAIELPSYLKYVHHASKAKVSCVCPVSGAASSVEEASGEGAHERTI
jgi:MFS family permease